MKRICFLFFIWMGSIAFSQTILDHDTLFSSKQESKLLSLTQTIKKETGLSTYVICTSNYWPFTEPKEFLQHFITDKPNSLVLLISKDVKKLELTSSDNRITKETLSELKTTILLPQMKNEKYFSGTSEALKKIKKVL